MGITPILFLLLGVLLKGKICFPQRKKKGKLFFYCSTGHAGKQEKGGGKRGKFSRQNEKGGKKRKGGFVFLSKVFYGSAMALAPGRKVG